MRLFSLFLLGLVFFKATGQERKTFSINWTQKVDEVSNQSYWYGADIQVQKGYVPQFVNQWEKEDKGTVKSYSFENIQERKLALNDLMGLDVHELPTSFNSSFRVIKERDSEFYSVEITPLYKNDKGEYIQIVSFDVVYSLYTNQTRVSATEGQNTVENSVLSTGTWYKVAVDKSGVFKMDVSFLRSLGINVEEIDPKKIRVFGNGGAILPELLSISRKDDLVENAILVSGEEDNVFDSEDYVLFYAQGPLSWELSDRESIVHKQNIYSNYAYYFINVDSGVDGQRITNKASVSGTVDEEITTFTDYLLQEQELINYLRTGRDWFGEDFSINQTQSFTFKFDNIVKTTPVLLDTRFSASASSATSYNVEYDNLDGLSDTNIKVISNASIPNVSGSISHRVQEASSEDGFNPENDEVVLNVTWNNNGDLSASGYLDYLKVVADRYLIANGKQFSFLNFSSTNDSGNVLEYVLSSQFNEGGVLENGIDYVWNITDIHNPSIMVDTDSSVEKFSFKELTDGIQDKYQLVKVSDAYTPIRIANDKTIVPNQNLHALEDVQYLIITNNELSTQAERLANYHRLNTRLEGTDDAYLNVEVIDVEQIYNEFGSGSPDITAIRDFVKYIYDNSSSETTKLKYLCLFGDATYDYKNITEGQENIVPTYLAKTSNSLTFSYNSDDYYAFLDETDDILDNSELSSSGKLDIATGRIPVDSPLIAQQYVDKVLNYYSVNSYGKWKNEVTLLGDDGQYGDDQSLIRYLENSALKIEENKPSLNLSKLYSDAFNEEIISGGGYYPDITQKFEDAFNNGSLVINYFGHGNTSQLAEENFFNISTIQSLRNLNNLPLFITITCDFSRFDDPTFLSAGEELMQGAYGGTSSMITTARQIRIFAANIINIELADYLYNFDGESRTIAESLKDTKNNLNYVDELFVYFLGDPAMKLSIPEDGVVIDKIEKYVTDPVTQEESRVVVNELNGLSKLRVTGRIVKKDNVLNAEGTYDVTETKIEDFKGDLSVVLYDKEIERSTLLNEAISSGGSFDETRVVYFNSLENKVFVGESSIENGAFSFDFILPKDISTLAEDAKFSFYASSSDQEKGGSNFSYKVGGIDADAVEDEVPPVISLFLEDESFVDGGTTSTRPTLIAKVQDDSGINTSLNSIGHTISLVIDGDLVNPIVLNEYYTTEKNDFTNGVIRYDLPELPVGNHTISLKVWDSYNNSATQALSFFVEEDLGFKISNVLNYPNPFINYTEFWFRNNREGNSLDVKVQVYTVSGKLIKTIISSVSSSNNNKEAIRSVRWDGRDDFGNKLGKGVYLYKLIVKDTNTGQSDEKIEKLVIL